MFFFHHLITRPEEDWSILVETSAEFQIFKLVYKNLQADVRESSLRCIVDVFWSTNYKAFNITFVQFLDKFIKFVASPLRGMLNQNLAIFWDSLFIRHELFTQCAYDCYFPTNSILDTPYTECL